MSEETMSQEETIKKLIKRVEKLERNAPQDKLCIGVMDGDYDKTMAAFIIALGAAAYDMEVDMFFTFWALPALRDPRKKPKKDFLGKMFGAMLPSSAMKMPLSKMQMMGMGPKMIQAVMKMHNAKSLEELMKDAAEFGIRIHVCTMAMDVMGIKKEEIIDYPHIDYLGVGAFVGMFSEAKQCWFM
ncbi:MAG: DsrE/DsrF/DrsH-like family protein [Pontiellaceae bacterium]|nr:DsrE/DsrF/DrsH-like family protein [Pontiellaceae bacterium]MBN2784711.1 DsrE/DsrF/DrsH-like family protein [Pontiellaceae bacterium]